MIKIIVDLVNNKEFRNDDSISKPKDSQNTLLMRIFDTTEKDVSNPEKKLQVKCVIIMSYFNSQYVMCITDFIVLRINASC